MSKEWVEFVDRGGLCRVNNITYELFFTMEKTLRKIVHASCTPCIPADCIKSIICNDDIQFIWCMISSDWSEGSADALLEMVVHQWTKIRGFLYASAWMERYKCEQQKNVQKTKGIRKQLMSKGSKPKKARIEPEDKSTDSD